MIFRYWYSCLYFTKKTFHFRVVFSQAPLSATTLVLAGLALICLCVYTYILIVCLSTLNYVLVFNVIL